MKVCLNYCKGTNGGHAIYLKSIEDDKSGTGYRVAGPKCWGYIKAFASFEMDKNDLENMIIEVKKAIEFLSTNHSSVGEKTK